MNLQEFMQGGGLLPPPARQQNAWSFETGGGIDAETERRARLYEDLLVGARNEAVARRLATEALEAPAAIVGSSPFLGTGSTGRLGIRQAATPATPVIGRAQNYLDAERIADSLEAPMATLGSSPFAGTASTGRLGIPYTATPATPIVERAQRFLDAERLAPSLEAAPAVLQASPLLTSAATGRAPTTTRAATMNKAEGPSLADAAPLVATEVVSDGLPFGRRARMAAERPLQTLGLAKDGKLRMGRVAGLGSILTLLSAASELNDPTESAGRNLAQAGGSAVGGLSGGAGGAFLGGLLTAGNPIGILVGSAIGNALGGGAGKGLATFAADLAEGSPEDRAIRNAQKQARAAAEAEAERARILMPIQDQAAQVALRNEEARQKMLSGIAAEQLLQRAMAEGLLAQQQSGAQQQLAMTNAILGGLI